MERNDIRQLSGVLVGTDLGFHLGEVEPSLSNDRREILRLVPIGYVKSQNGIPYLVDEREALASARGPEALTGDVEDWEPVARDLAVSRSDSIESGRGRPRVPR